MRFILLALSLLSLPAHAQSEPDHEERARVRFEEGTAALRDGRHAEAAAALEESHQLTPNVSNAFNLAVAWRALGRLREASVLLDRLLLGELGELDAERHEVVSEERRQVRAEQPQLVIDVRGGEAEVEVDGVPAGTARGAALLVEANPGTRTIEVRPSHGAPITRTVEVERSTMPRISIVIAPPPESVPVAEPIAEPVAEPHDDAEPPSRLRAWILVVGAFVVVGLGVGLTVGLRGVRSDDPIEDPVTGLGRTLLAF